MRVRTRDSRRFGLGSPTKQPPLPVLGLGHRECGASATHFYARTICAIPEENYCACGSLKLQLGYVALALVITWDLIVSVSPHRAPMGAITHPRSKWVASPGFSGREEGLMRCSLGSRFYH